MPAPVDKLHDKLISDPDFYPEKSEKEQEAIAWAIAYSQYNKSKKKKKKKSKRKSDIINHMVKIAEYLDNAGIVQYAELLDEILQDDVSGNSDI